MGEDRPVKDYVERRIERDDPGRDVKQDIIARTLAEQFVKQFLHDICAGILALPSGAAKCPCRPATAAAMVIDGHAIAQTVMAQHCDMAVADRDEVCHGWRADRLCQCKRWIVGQ